MNLNSRTAVQANAQASMNQRILMIAYHYPPVRVSSGIQRTLKFSTYLRHHGWDPLILTVSPRAYEKVSDDQMKEIPAELPVGRAFCLDTARHLALGGRYFHWMALPDRWVSWIPAGVLQGLRMIRRHRPSAIFSTYPIASAHLIGLILARLTGLPWIADFRDSMTEPGYPADPLTWQVHRKLEQEAVRWCSRAIFTTQGTLKMYAERYPEIPQSRWAVIENGFDEENFKSAESDLQRTPRDSSHPVTLIHSGLLYPQERDPRPFFAALKKLLDEGEIGPGNLKIILRATGADALYKPMLEEYGLSGIVDLAPTVAYREALREMMTVDGLLLFQAAMCNHQVPAKIYEYFRAGRPIFAMTDPAGDTADTLRQAGVDSIAEITDVEDIARRLRRFLGEIRDGRASGVAPATASLHSRSSRTHELAAMLNALCPIPESAA